jgi:hypothetical protein
VTGSETRLHSGEGTVGFEMVSDLFVDFAVPSQRSFVEFISLVRLSQSVVLCQGRGGIQKIALFSKSPYYGMNS